MFNRLKSIDKSKKKAKLNLSKFNQWKIGMQNSRNQIFYDTYRPSNVNEFDREFLFSPGSPQPSKPVRQFLSESKKLEISRLRHENLRMYYNLSNMKSVVKKSMKHKKQVLDNSRILSTTRRHRIQRYDPTVNLYLKNLSPNDSHLEVEEIRNLISENFPLTKSSAKSPEKYHLKSRENASNSSIFKKTTNYSTTNSSWTGRNNQQKRFEVYRTIGPDHG